MSIELIDAPALREYLGPNGPWAKECGQRVRKYRERMGERFTETWLAGSVGATVTTIKMVEAGALVPRDYLRAALAFALGQDVDTLWPTLNRERVREIGQVA